MSILPVTTTEHCFKKNHIKTASIFFENAARFPRTSVIPRIRALSCQEMPIRDYFNTGENLAEKQPLM